MGEQCQDGAAWASHVLASVGLLLVQKDECVSVSARTTSWTRRGKLDP